jgi:hypothetical protein
MTASTLPASLPSQRAAIRFGWLEFLRRLFRTTQAQIGGAIVMLLMLTAVFAPLGAPRIRRRRHIRLAPTISAETC